jgi:hypothetical protein
MKDQIISLYISGLSIREIALILGIGKSTAAKWVLTEGISRPRRIRTSILESKIKKIPILTQPQVSFLDGLVISDGHLRVPRKVVKTSAYMQTSVVPDWLYSIQQEFSRWQVECSVSPEKRNRGSCSWIIQTESYDQFHFQRTRWYPDGGIKRVPRDIDLSNLDLMRNWIYGDGTRVRSTLRLCTDDFLVEDVNFLVKELKITLGYSFSLVFMGDNKKGLPKLRLSLGKRQGLIDLLDRIGNPLDLFSYKFKI